MFVCSLVSILSHWQWWIIMNKRVGGGKHQTLLPEANTHSQFSNIAMGQWCMEQDLFLSPCSCTHAVYRYIPIRADILITWLKGNIWFNCLGHKVLHLLDLKQYGRHTLFKSCSQHLCTFQEKGAQHTESDQVPKFGRYFKF